MKYTKKIITIIFSCKLQITIISICMLVIMGINFIMPFVTQYLFDEGFGKNDFIPIVKYSVIICFLGIGVGISGIIKEICRVRIYSKLYHRLKEDAIHQLMCIDMCFFVENNPTSVYQAITEDIENISSLADDGMFEIITAAFSAVGGGVALFIIDWHLALLVIGFIPVQLLLNYIILRKGVKIAKAYNYESNKYSKSFGNAVQGIKDIRLGGIEKATTHSLLHKLISVLKISEKRRVFQQLSIEGEGMFVYVITSIGAIVAGVLLINNNISLGTIIAFQTYSLILLNSVCSGIGMIYNIGTISPSLDRYYSFLSYRKDSSGINTDVQLGDIRLSGVSYSYDEEFAVLQDCNLTIKLGSKVVIRGSNGSGKTTLMNLILGLLKPSAGKITLGESNIASVDINTYRLLFCVVFQDPFLFNTSIRENICMFNSNIDDTRLKQIISAVNLQDVVESKGLEYEIGENGCKLSAGQRQKLALARVLAYDRPIIILDEFTSNMDVETVEVLRELFGTEFKNKTVLCITHSNTLLDLFDTTLHIEKGLINNESCDN